MTPADPDATRDTTIDHVPAAGPTADPPAADGTDTRALLQRQLRRAVGFFLAITVVTVGVLAWLQFAPAGGHGTPVPTPLQLASIAAEGVVVVVAAVVVFARRPVSLRRLRAVELVLFGFLTLNLATNMMAGVRDGDLAKYFALLGGEGVSYRAKGYTTTWMALIVLYGTFIPNTARRCVAVTTAMAAMALGGVAAGLAAHGDDGRVAVPALFSMGVWVGSAVMIAVYGAYRIDSFRREAAVARHLGPYTLVRKLGAGGMGEVHLAEHRLLKRPCAVKLIRPDKAADTSAVRRFEREVQAATRLTHPAVVQVYDYGREADGTFYYVMEYLPGRTLDDIVRDTGPLPAGRAVYALRQVCGALAEAHALGLVHRDVKPANVMLGRLGGRADAAKLLDFGLVADARDTDPRLTQAGGVLGTPAYLSPEQARGADAGPAADLYSLGATAYFLLTGKPPFVRPNQLAVMHAHQHDPVTPPSELAAGIPAAVEAVVLRLLAKDPADRFASAAAVDAALAGCGTEWTAADADRWWAANDG